MAEAILWLGKAFAGLVVVLMYALGGWNVYAGVRGLIDPERGKNADPNDLGQHF